MTLANKIQWLGLFVIAATLFVVVNRGAYKGYFQDDDLDNIAFTGEIGGTEFAKYTLLPIYIPNNFRPVGHVFYRWMGRAAGLNFPPYIFAIHAFHLVNVVLLWFVMLRLGVSPAAAGAGALFFIFHVAVFDVYWKPMYVFDLLCCTFCLMSLLFYMRDHWILSLLLFLLAYHAKEVAIMLPAVLAVYEFLLGQRKWKRLIPFFVASAIICGQAFLQNLARADTPYKLHFDPFSIWNCILFYSSYLFLVPYAGFAALLLVLMFRDRRVIFGLLAFCLLLMPMLLLPGRLFSAYLYVPLAGLAIGIGALSTHVDPALIALFFVIWLPWNQIHLRQLRSTALSDVADRRAFVDGVTALSRSHPDILTFLYVSGPMRQYAARGVLRILHPGREIRFASLDDPEFHDLLQSKSVAALDWDRNHHKLIAGLRTADTRPAAYIQMGPGMPLWQLEKGWYTSEDQFRWTEPLATAQLARPAGAKQFELVVTIGDVYIQSVKTSHIVVSLNNIVLGEREFTRPGVETVHWDLPPGPPGPAEITIQTTPPLPFGNRILGCAVVSFGFLPREHLSQ